MSQRSSQWCNLVILVSVYAIAPLLAYLRLTSLLTTIMFRWIPFISAEVEMESDCLGRWQPLLFHFAYHSVAIGCTESLCAWGYVFRWPHPFVLWIPDSITPPLASSDVYLAILRCHPVLDIVFVDWWKLPQIPSCQMICHPLCTLTQEAAEAKW